MPLEFIREKRFWLDCEGGYRHSGKPDLVVLDRDNSFAVVLDYKTGRKEVPTSATNPQLRDLAVLVAYTFGLTKVAVSPVQPWAPKQPACIYELDDLIRAREDLERRVRASNDPEAKRIAGPVQCQYCRARGTCPEFAAASLPVQLETTPTPTKETVQTAIATMPAARLGIFLAFVRLAEEVAESRVRELLAEGQGVDGWKLSPGRTRETITDPQEAFNRFVALGGKADDFLATVTVAKGKLRDAVKAVTGDKGKVLESKFADLLAGITESKESAPILEQTK